MFNYLDVAVMGTIRKRAGFRPLQAIRVYTRHLTLEQVFSTICFLAALAFLTAALMGMWRHFFTMGLSILVGIMISDDDQSESNQTRHKD